MNLAQMKCDVTRGVHYYELWWRSRTEHPFHTLASEIDENLNRSLHNPFKRIIVLNETSFHIFKSEMTTQNLDVNVKNRLINFETASKMSKMKLWIFEGQTYFPPAHGIILGSMHGWSVSMFDVCVNMLELE